MSIFDKNKYSNASTPPPVSPDKLDKYKKDKKKKKKK